MEMYDCLRRAAMVGLITAVVVLSIALVTKMKPVIEPIPTQNLIPSAREIQQRLKDLDDPRYDPGPIDGISGPKMIRGWDNYICDQYAKKAIKGD